MPVPRSGTTWSTWNMGSFLPAKLGAHYMEGDREASLCKNQVVHRYPSDSASALSTSAARKGYKVTRNEIRVLGFSLGGPFSNRAILMRQRSLFGDEAAAERALRILSVFARLTMAYAWLVQRPVDRLEARGGEPGHRRGKRRGRRRSRGANLWNLRENDRGFLDNDNAWVRPWDHALLTRYAKLIEYCLYSMGFTL